MDRLETRLKLDPNDTIVLARLGHLHLRLGRSIIDPSELRRAEEIYRKIYKILPDDTAAMFGIARALHGQHKFQEALDWIRQALVLARDDIGLLSLLGDVHLALGHSYEAIAIFQDLVDRAPSLETTARLALAFDALGKTDEAWATMRQAAEVGDQQRSPRSNRAWCQTMLGDLAIQRGDLITAFDSYQAALELDPSAHAAVFGRAQVRARQGDLETAQKDLHQLVHDYGVPRYIVGLAEAHQSIGDLSDLEVAKNLLHEAEHLLSADVQAGDLGHARELVELWLKHGGDPREAAELAMRELEEVRQDAATYETAAWAKYHAGDFAEAQRLIRESLARSPSRARALWRAAAIYSSQGEDQIATNLLRSAMERDPTIVDRLGSVP